MCWRSLVWWVEAGLPLGDQRSEPTAAAELGLLPNWVWASASLPQLTLFSDDEPELETVPVLPGPAGGGWAASG